MRKSEKVALMRAVLAEMHAAGCTRNEVAAALQITPSGVTYHAKALGLEFLNGRKGVLNRRTPELRARIVALRAEGMTPDMIASRVFLGAAAVRWHLRQAAA